MSALRASRSEQGLDLSEITNPKPNIPASGFPIGAFRNDKYGGLSRDWTQSEIKHHSYEQVGGNS